jgi:hypothetical protein
MKVWHFLQVSSEIIGKQRYRTNVTTLASSIDLQIVVASTTNQANAPSYLLGGAGGLRSAVAATRTKRVILPAQLRQPITEQEHPQFDHTTHLVRGGMQQPVED